MGIMCRRLVSVKVGPVQLIPFIDLHAPYFWHSVPTPIGNYLLSLWEKNDQLDKQSNLIAFSDSRFYIEIDLVKDEDLSQDRKSKPSPVNILEEISNNRVILIEAEMGFGKSKLLRQIIDKLSSAKSFLDTGRIPVSTTYRTLIEDFDSDVEKLVSHYVGDVIQFIDKDKCEFILLVDGVDEVIESSEKHTEKLSKLVEFIAKSKNIRAIFATRPLRWLDKELATQKFAKRYMIRPLSTSKITKFIDQICTQINLSKRLIEDIKKSQLFKQLPHSPIAAILLSNLLAQSTKDLPSNLTELYAKSMELMLGRWDIDKGLLTQKEYEASDSFSGEIAKFMLDNGLNRIGRGEAEQMLRTYLDERNLGLEHAPLFEKIITRTGVFAQDKDTGTIFFRHRSFAEFIYARHLWRTSKLEVDKRIFDYYWINTYFFYVGLHKDCPELLREIIQYPVTSEGERWLKVFNMGNYFLAGYASPYSVVQQNFSAIFIAAAKLFQDVKSGQTDTRFNELPEATIMWLIQAIMRQSYGFEFFRKAIDDSVIQISDALETDETKAYALFLLGLVGVEINQVAPLDYLVDQYGFERLPLVVSVGIRLEATSPRN